MSAVVAIAAIVLGGVVILYLWIEQNEERRDAMRKRKEKRR